MPDPLETFDKDPDALLDYGFNWAPWLPTGDTIASATWTIAPVCEGGLEVDHQTETTKIASVWLTGGNVGQSYDVTCHVVTAGGREDDRSFRVNVLER